MATEKFRTIGAVFDYTFKYKDTWQPSHKQYQTCRHHADKFMSIHGHGYKIKDISQETMNIVKTALREQQDASNRTVNLCVNNVAIAINYCILNNRVAIPTEHTSFNYTKRKYSFEQLEVQKVDKPLFTKDQVIHMYEWGTRLSKSAGQMYLNCAETILLTATTGVPWHEFVQLKASDVKFDGPIPILDIGNRKDFNLKRAVRKREIPLIGNAALMIPILKRRIDDVEGSNDYYLFGDDWLDHDKRGRDQHLRFFEKIRNDLRYEFDERGERRTPYCLRHSFCTWSLRDGNCLERTRYLMGHSSIETTRGYLHLVAEDYVKSMPASPEFKELATRI